MGIWITGAEGQLGAELRRQLGPTARGLNRAMCDLTTNLDVRKLPGIRPGDTLINCAAYTHVDQAESDIDACELVNHHAVATLVEQCRELGMRLVHISTDYVFDSNTERKARSEESPTQPRGVYARSKLRGERVVLAVPGNLVVRTCGLFGTSPRSSNFVSTMLRLSETQPSVSVVDDQTCCPSYTRDVAAGVLWLLAAEGMQGLFHVANRGAVTWYQFACEIFRLAGLDTRVVPISTAQFAAAAPRPYYSVLDVSKYHAFGGIPMPSVSAGLATYLAELDALRNPTRVLQS